MYSSFNFDAIDQRTKRVTPALIDAVADRIVHFLQPHKILLFGSQVGEQVREESDIDLLIIVNNHHRLASLQHRVRAGEVLDLFRYRSFGLDVIVLTEEEIQQIQSANEGEWDLILEILSTGKPRYERAKDSTP